MNIQKISWKMILMSTKKANDIKKLEDVKVLDIKNRS